MVVGNNGSTLANVTKTLTALPNVTSAEIAPIAAFEVNLVGPINSESGAFVRCRHHHLFVINDLDGPEQRAQLHQNRIYHR